MGEEYQQIKDMGKQYRIGDAIGLLPQENIRWELTAHRSLRLAGACALRISAVVTRIKYRGVRGELVRSYELSRRKGRTMPFKEKSAHLWHEHSCNRKGTRWKLCARAFNIDPVYENAPNNKFFPYAIESSFIYCMPEVGSQVHIYFPGAEMKAAR